MWLTYIHEIWWCFGNIMPSLTQSIAYLVFILDLNSTSLTLLKVICLSSGYQVCAVCSGYNFNIPPSPMFNCHMWSYVGEFFVAWTMVFLDLAVIHMKRHWHN